MLTISKRERKPGQSGAQVRLTTPAQKWRIDALHGQRPHGAIETKSLITLQIRDGAASRHRDKAGKLYHRRFNEWVGIVR